MFYQVADRGKAHSMIDFLGKEKHLKDRCELFTNKPFKQVRCNTAPLSAAPPTPSLPLSLLLLLPNPLLLLTDLFVCCCGCGGGGACVFTPT